MDKEVEDSAPGRIRFNFWMTRSIYIYLEEIANKEGRSMSDIVREALRDYQLKHRQINKGVGDG